MPTATYSPEDNKLRLYPESRLDKETYERVRGAGFIWAPKQELFVAPAWTPSRESLLIDLCGEIGDEDTSLVDRAEDRAERFEDYSDRRREDAAAAHKQVEAIAGGIPLGQPILVGHHSERHARKDAERIETGMRRAVKMWETANYWKQRAAGAVRAAKYKELPGVRARRIKGLEADKRSHERDIERAETFTKAWSVSLEWDPEVRRLTREQARAIANYDNACSSMSYSLKDYPRNPPASQYEGAMGLWSALGDTDEQAIITPEQARDFALRSHAATIRHANRWLQHINNRLDYERAMLEEQGGTAANKFDMQPGGRILRRGEWLVITKVNKRSGVVNSVSVLGHWASTVPVDEIKDYQPPAEGDAETVKTVTKQLPLCNFRSEGCIEMTSAEWKEKSKWTDAFAVRGFDADGQYHWRSKENAPIVYRHRSRYYLGSHRAGDGSKVVRVFLTDAKEVQPPTSPKVATVPTGFFAPVPEPETPARVTRRARGLDDLHESMFYGYESGNLKAGIKFLYSGEGWADCYQYRTVADLVACARAYESQPRILGYKIVTHSGEYKDMSTVYEWQRDAEMFDALKETLRTGVKVVSAPQLFPTPPDLARRMVSELGATVAGLRVLEPSAGTGNLIHALHNSATGADNVRVVAVEVNEALADGLEKRRQLTIGANAQNFDIRRADFLSCNGDLGKFDAIVMNPPFENGSDIKHIRHAAGMLKPGGRLVAICANGPRQREALMPMAEASGGWWEDLPADTFKSAGTSVNTALLVIEGPSQGQTTEAGASGWLFPVEE
jgi:SAM-dependent methyltransferase